MANIFSLGICCHRNYLEGSGAERRAQGEGAQGCDLKGARVLLRAQTHRNKKVHEVVCFLDSSLLNTRLFLVTPAALQTKLLTVHDSDRSASVHKSVPKYTLI